MNKARNPLALEMEGLRAAVETLIAERDLLRERERETVKALADLMGVAIRAPSCMEPDCRICPANRAIMAKARALLTKNGR